MEVLRLQPKRTLQASLLCLCLLAGQFIPAVDAATRSCQAVETTFRELSVVDENGVVSGASGEIFSELAAVGDPSERTCKLSETCCSVETEPVLRAAAVASYHDQLSDVLTQYILPAYNHTLFGAIDRYLDENKNFLVAAMLQAYSIYFEPYIHIFDDFYSYVQQSIRTGNACDLGQQFNRVFFEIYLAAYVVSPATGGAAGLPNTAAFRECFYNFFLDENYEDLNNYYQAFTRSFNRTMHYLRALRTADSVLLEVLGQRFSPQCKDSLMKMTYCSECAGYSSPVPCYDYCMNTMRGCLVDLSDLAGPFHEFADAVVAMKDLLDTRYDPWVQFDLLHQNFFEVISNTNRDGAGIRNRLLSTCNQNGRITRDTSKRQTSGPGLTTRQTVEPPRNEMNQSAYALVALQSIFRELPESVCAEDTGEGRNDNCWNGRQIGSYTRQVVSYDRASQIDNPEVLLCSTSTRYQEQISQLRQITRDLNILTGNYVCSSDDEDCSVDLGECDFEVPSAIVPDLEAGSSNGAPSSCSTCFDVCADEADSSSISIISPTSVSRTISPTATGSIYVPGVVIEPTGTPGFKPPIPGESPHSGSRQPSLLSSVVLLVALCLVLLVQVG